jgi:hypothetical protein
MFRDIDDPIVNLDVLTSPVIFHERRSPSDDFGWAAGLMGGLCPGALPEFDVAGLAFADLKCALDGPKPAAAPAPRYPMPVLGPQRLLPKVKKCRSGVPCVFQPFTSFAATELVVSQLRAALRDRQVREQSHKLDL